MMANYDWYRTVLPDVMTHGDTWVNNVLFEREDGGEAGARIAAFIDWQICFEGCGLNDLARVSTWCVDPQLRVEHEHEIVARWVNLERHQRPHEKSLPFYIVFIDRFFSY